MFLKGLSSYRGCHIPSLTAKAAIAGTTLAMLGMTVGTASASIIYQDTFSGSSTLGTLNGATPNKVDTNNATWTASSSSTYGWSDSGYANVQPYTSYGSENASLPFTPVAGQIYTLSAGLDLTAKTDPSANLPNSDYWMALGFITTPSSGWGGSGASPWVLTGYQASQDTVFQGPGTFNGTNFSPGITSGVNDVSIVLNTGSTLWSYQAFLTNSANVNPLLIGSGTFTANPAITAVGMEDGLGLGQASNFSLTDVAVPEPATLGLVAAGGLGLLLLKRRKAV